MRPERKVPILEGIPRLSPRRPGSLPTHAASLAGGFRLGKAVGDFRQVRRGESGVTSLYLPNPPGFDAAAEQVALVPASVRQAWRRKLATCYSQP